MEDTNAKAVKRVKKKIASDFDVLGSWTGNYLMGDYEEPVQDADDL